MTLIAATLRKHPHLMNATPEEILEVLEAQRASDPSLPSLFGELGYDLAGGAEDLLKRCRELRGRSLPAGGGCAQRR